LRLRGLRRGEIFGSALLQPARSVCVSLSAFFIHLAFLEVGELLVIFRFHSQTDVATAQVATF